MKLYHQILKTGIAVLTASLFLFSCDEGPDNDTDADDLSIPLTVAGTDIKAAGRGQYRLSKRLVEDSVLINADLSSFADIKSLTITKTINTVVATDFGNNGVLTVDPASINSVYTLDYSLQEQDLDQLVGLTFRAESTTGEVKESDLTLTVTLTPRENIPRRKWNWVSIKHVNEGNAEVINTCEQDNYYLFNSDSTIVLNYGTDTGTGACQFDGFWANEKWHLTEDGKLLVVQLKDIFFGSVRMDSFRVKSLTVDEMKLEIDYDLGNPTEDTFLYELVATPR